MERAAHTAAIQQMTLHMQLNSALATAAVAPPAPAVLHQPAVPVVDGPHPLAPAVTKLITAQLVLHNTASAMAANALDDQASVDRIRDVALKLLESLRIMHARRSDSPPSTRDPLQSSRSS